MQYISPTFIIPYTGFTNFTNSLPSFYWDVYSSEQRIKHICRELCKLSSYAEYLADAINQDHIIIEQLQDDFTDFQEHGFERYYENQIHEWINENMEDIIRESMMMVWFGITDDGYFVAYIPDTWDDIIFDTYLSDYDDEKYGRLILKYEVDSPHTVTQP